MARQTLVIYICPFIQVTRKDQHPNFTNVNHSYII